MRLRILPILVVACLILLGIKGIDLTQNKQELSNLLVPSLNAEESDKTSEQESFPEEENEDRSLIDDENKVDFSETELQILKRLAKRREVLEVWEKDLSVKENVLSITQGKIDKKILELRTLKTEVESVLKEYEDKEHQKTKSLVKIYESMKPTDAAAIFTELDLTTLLQIVNNMKETKAALIIAKMNPVLAKELTVRFAQRGTIAANQKRNR